MNRVSPNIVTIFLSFAGVLISADGATSEVAHPVGAVPLSAPANSDTVISLSVSRPPAFSGVIASVSGDTLSVVDAPGWTSNRFVRNSGDQTDTYYVQLRTGEAAGHFYTVTANSLDTLTVNWNGETPAAKAGDRFDLVPYWTLGTAYPASDAGKSFTASPSALLRKTELLFLDPNFVGINPPPTTTYYFFNGTWRKVGAAVTTSFNDTVIVSETYFIQRNKTDATRLVTVGSVVAGPIATLIIAQAGSAKQDNPIALPFAGVVTLGQSNLAQSGAFQSSPSALLRKDELLVFDNASIGINKPPVATYYYMNNGWRKVGASVTTDFSSEPIFTPGTGVLLRKAGTGTATAQSSFWIYTVAGL